jgi:hypothetical protein
MPWISLLTSLHAVRGEIYGSAPASRRMAAKEEAARQALLKFGVPV